MFNLDSRIERELRDAKEKLERSGNLLLHERLDTYYAAFRDRFGPEKLQSLDGQALLQTVHGLGNKDGLVRWLEFKDDEEFRGGAFGSIAGGAAFKYLLFPRMETGQWVTGNPQHEVIVSEGQAIEITREHRKQLLAGTALLHELPANADEEHYAQLQGQLEKVAHDLSGRGWVHKYFSLLFPDKLEQFHSQAWQRFNLIKLLQLPPQREGLYVAAGRFVSLAVHLGWPMNHLCRALTERNGPRARYWRIRTRLGEADGQSLWPAMRDGSYIAVRPGDLGDLSPFLGSRGLRETIQERLAAHHRNDAKTLAREISDFTDAIAEGDVVVATDGRRVLGLGKVTGPYTYVSAEPTAAPHRRPVDWVSTSEWDLRTLDALHTAVARLRQPAPALIEIERRMLDGRVQTPPNGPSVLTRRLRLEGIPGQVQAILERKGQAILHGPPGTGKTYWARKTAFDLASLKAFEKRFEELSDDQRAEVEGTPTTPGLVRSCTFHPAYGYEDFIEGFRPQSSGMGNLIFELTDGILKRICADARQSDQRKKDRTFILLVDEINRGDIPRIFGELLTLLELDKRGSRITLPLSQEVFSVPRNLYLIGTMNTADRSIALLDAALRRRFGFVPLMPQPGVFDGAWVEDTIPLGAWLTRLNGRIRQNLGRDARNLQIGHAYFLEYGKPVKDLARFARILAEDIIPLLEEYCYENYEILKMLLGEGMVDLQQQRIRGELFLPARRDDLVAALRSHDPDVIAAPQAASAASARHDDESEEAESEGDNE
jgi:5-methylcytosine-specific restriction enzyme B